MPYKERIAQRLTQEASLDRVRIKPSERHPSACTHDTPTKVEGMLATHDKTKNSQVYKDAGKAGNPGDDTRPD